jgi:hypothetical protein
MEEAARDTVVAGIVDTAVRSHRNTSLDVPIAWGSLRLYPKLKARNMVVRHQYVQIAMGFVDTEALWPRLG